MFSRRFCQRRGPSRVPIAWCLVAVFWAAAAFIVARGCAYDLSLPLRYGAYVGLQVALPGAVALYLANVRPLSLTTLVALGVPTGFALEILSFIGLSAAHLTGLMPLLPLGWMAAGTIAFLRRRDVPRITVGAGTAWTAAAFSLLVFGMVLSAASRMYAESPLIDGLPQRPIFHDWVYLLSRAATIKHLWPLEDPSLAGVRLQYHYFMLVHVASASVTTGVDVTWILLRLAVIPLGVVVLTQAYVLGRRLSSSAWGGVLTAALLLLAGEASAADDYGRLTYLGFFLRWLYVSPTFFFGLIFFGALLIGLAQVQRLTWTHAVWLGVLAAVGTAAKGSVLPVLILGFVLYAAYAWCRDGRSVLGEFRLLVALVVPFVVVYAFTMSAWGAGDATVQPFRICEITDYWQEHAVPVQRWLKRALAAPALGTWLGKSWVAVGVLAGTYGVQAIGLLQALRPQSAPSRRLTRLLVATVLASCLLGLALHFDGEGELYFLFLGRLPLAALAAATVVSLCRIRSAAGVPPASGLRHRLGGPWLRHGTLAAGTACLALQIGTTVRCETRGLRDWLNFDPCVRVNADLLPLYETTRWLKENTEPDAILVSNAFTQPNLREGRGVSVDHTTVGVYYYYSALTERRMWVEGPTYLLDQAEAKRRLVASARMFYQHKAPNLANFGAPTYLVVDHSIADGAAAPKRGVARVFANHRFEVFRVLGAGRVFAAAP